MRNGLGLCVLGLLSLYSSVSGQPGVLIFCDDPSVQEAVVSALHKFNERMSTGNKLALFQILKASKSGSGSDSMYSLEFTTRRSNCPAGSSTPWKDCDYLPVDKLIWCNATVPMTATDADKSQVDCVLNDHILLERANCMGCPEVIDENSEDLKSPLSSAVNKYNSISDHTHLFSLHNVGPAIRQVIAGFRFNLKFDLRRTTCAKAEHTELSDQCAHDDQNVEFVNCNSTVDVAPWRHEPPQSHVSCEPGTMPVMFDLRRRPPGWSPLRKVETKAVTPTPPSPSKSTVKEESSEEDTIVLGPSASPGVTPNADPSTDSPFRCPSTPWKPFNPPTDAGPTAAMKTTVEKATPAPTTEGAFSDKDLLA